MPVTWSDEKLILGTIIIAPVGVRTHDLPHCSFKHGQSVPRPYSLGHGGGLLTKWLRCRTVSVSVLANNALRAHHASAHGGVSTNGLSDILLIFLKLFY